MDYYDELLELPLVRRPPLPQNVYNFLTEPKIKQFHFLNNIFQKKYLKKLWILKVKFRKNKKIVSGI